MHPIKEFDFSGIEKTLAREYIKVHNQIVKEVNVISSVATDPISNNYLKIFTSAFANLDDSDETLVTETIICASKKQLDGLLKACNKRGILSKEQLPCNKLTGISYYSRLQKEINKLNVITIRTKAQDDKLAKYQKEFNATIGLRPLLQKIFDYSGRRKLLLQYYAVKGYRVCAYCLAQYTSIYRSSKSGKFYLTGNLDHVKAKSTYPYLSLSINNLVPVCGHCNQRKSDRKFKYDPFNPAHKQAFDFSECIDVVKSKVVFKPLKKLKFSPSTGYFTDLREKLEFKDLYQNFELNAKMMVDRYQKYHSHGYNEHLKSITEKTDSREFIEYFISEVPLSDESVLKHPLTKFKMDLYNTIKSKGGKL